MYHFARVVTGPIVTTLFQFQREFFVSAANDPAADHVHVMVGGRIVRSGGKDLALELEERGYDWAREAAGEMAFSK